MCVHDFTLIFFSVHESEFKVPSALLLFLGSTSVKLG